jgi:hypothetical protein
VSEKTVVNFRVTGEGPAGPTQALFSNFLAVSQVGTEVQFEFVFLDLNVLAEMIGQQKAAPSELAAMTPTVSGKTVAKVVMPAAVFAQMKEHFDKIYNALAQEGIPPKASEEKKNERHSTSVGQPEGR